MTTAAPPKQFIKSPGKGACRIHGTTGCSGLGKYSIYDLAVTRHVLGW